jgi:hypothetical protein
MAKKDQPIKTDAEVISPAKAQSQFNFILQVINPFGRYQKGALIVQDDAIQAVIDNGDMPNCNRLPRR